MTDERNESIATSNYGISPELTYYCTKTRVESSGSCLKQDEVTWKVTR